MSGLTIFSGIVPAKKSGLVPKGWTVVVDDLPESLTNLRGFEYSYKLRGATQLEYFDQSLLDEARRVGAVGSIGHAKECLIDPDLIPVELRYPGAEIYFPDTVVRDPNGVEYIPLLQCQKVEGEPRVRWRLLFHRVKQQAQGGHLIRFKS